MQEQIITEYMKDTPIHVIAKKLNISGSKVKNVINQHFGRIPIGWDRTMILHKDKYVKAMEDYINEPKCSMLELKRRYPDLKLSQIKRFLEENNVKIKDQSDLYGFVENHELFTDINTELQAYLLGFFLADGHLQIDKNKNTCMKINVHFKDVHILKLYKKAINALDYVIHLAGNTAYLSFSSKKIGQSLISMGIDNRKTQTLKCLPKIDNKMYRHLIRGYFDGDGCMTVTRRRRGKRLGGYNKQFSISSGNKPILEDICKHLSVSSENIYHRPPETNQVLGHIAHFKDSYVLSINDTSIIKDIYNYLYEDSMYFFKRKRDLFELAILSTDEIDAVLQGNL